MRIDTVASGPSPVEWTGSLDATGAYYLGVWSESGSGNFIATIEADTTEPLVITSGPTGITLLEGEDAAFTVTATGNGALSYQWLANGVAITGAVSETLVISPTTLADSGTVYSVVVTDNTGSVTSDGATLTVNEAPITLAITTQPVDVTVIEGEDATFVVAATGSGTLGYQWLADGVAITGAVSETLVVSPTTLADSGTVYSVVVTDNTGSVTSDGATLTVNEAPITLAITTQPVDVTVIEGEDATFAVAATGSGTLGYQWLADGVEITGAVSETLVVSPTTLADSGTFYSVVVTDDTGSVTSDVATLTVNEAPITLAITTQPADVTVIEGEDATFVVAATGSGTLTYQWLADGVAITGAVSETLVISPTTLANSGTVYSAVVTDDTGSVTSDGATLTVNEAPITLAITTQPADVTVIEGENATFVVAATGSGTLGYQWLADGVEITGAVSETLVVSPTTLADSGTVYSVVVTDDTSSVTSDVATLTVNEAPVTLAITTQPVDVTVTEGEDATFTVIATGNGALSYQWLGNGVAITGAVSETLVISPTTLADSGTVYSVVVTDNTGSVTSDGATLTVNEAPNTLAITTQPVDVTVIEGEDATFVVAATGSGTLGYQWLADGVAITGAVSETLVVSPTTPADSGTVYSVVVTDNTGSVTSDGATLTVNEAPITLAITTQPVDVTVIEGEDATFAVAATGSGTLGYQWLADGVEITGAVSETLVVSPTTLADSGTFYSVVVTDDTGSVTSDVATLTVNEAPITLAITTQPADVTVIEGEDATFVVAATGSGTLTYQWLADGVAITGAVSETLVISPTTLANSGTVYSAVVTDDTGSVTSDGATLTVNEAPITLAITTQPADVTVIEGENATFVVAATGSGTLGYQWLADGVEITGAVSETLVVSPTTLADSGTVYSVVVTDDTSSVTSDGATLTVNEAPVTLAITTQPVGVTVTEGEDATFAVTATGSGTLTYQWLADGVDIPGAISETLLISPTALADSGTVYSVVVTDDNGSEISNNALLTVNAVTPVTVVTIGEGTLDADIIVAPRWVRLNFDPLANATHTVTVSWDSDADLRYIVREEDGTRLSPTVRDSNPGQWSGELDLSKRYYIGLWSSNGIANYTATIAATVQLTIDTQPADLTVTEGENATFAVAASGSGALSYQWLANGAVITGANSETLTISPTALADSGTVYSVVITDDNGSLISDGATLTVNEAPVTLAIATQPADITVIEGEDATFSVVASGSGALSYQWLANAVPISGATSDILIISPAALSDSGTVYSVIVTDDNGSVTSDSATLTVSEVPVTLAITSQPVDVTVTEGEDAMFSVVAIGSGVLSYQWFAHTTDTIDDTTGTVTINPPVEIPGATGTTLTVSPATLADSLTAYSVVVTDDNGSITSELAVLTVEAAPVTVAITTQPVDLTVTEGEDATFTVGATGSGTLSYQWLADGIAITDAITDTLVVSAAALTDSGTVYSVVVTDDNGSVTSDNATLTVNEAPVSLVITTQPMDLTVTEGDDAIFSVIATGSGTLSYQWFADSTPISGATSDTLIISPALLADSGTAYWVEVTDDTGSVDSDFAILVVNEAVDAPVTIVNVGQGTVDSDRNAGPRWVRVDFDSLATARHTITVSWDSDADVRFNVFESDGTSLSSVVEGANPGTWEGDLDANKQYYLGLWSVSGIANYTVTIEATVPLAIERQPIDLIVTAGDDATFVVEAVGSGTLSYQWFADGNLLSGETESTLTIFSSSLLDNGVTYAVQVSNEIESVMSDVATLTVNEPLVLGLFSEDADTSAWMLSGPAPTLDYRADASSDGWGQTLLRVGDLLLVGGDFEGIKPERDGPVTQRPFLAALDAVTGQPVTTFQVPSQVDSVVRSLVLSPSGTQVFAGGDFGLLMLNAATGELENSVSVTDGNSNGRVFDIAVTDVHIYIGGDFNNVNGTFRANIARLFLDGELDSTWSPDVTNGFSAGRSAPVQAVTVSPSGEKVYVGGNFGLIEGVAVDRTPQNKKISLLAVSALDGTVQPERFSAEIGNNNKALQVHDIAVTDNYVIVAWGGPNYLTFHSLAGDTLRQYNAKGDVQALQVVGDHVFVGHHGEFFGFISNPIPPEAVESRNPDVLVPYKFHSFRIDDPSFPPEQAWKLSGAFGVWGLAVAEDSIWIAGQIFRAGLNDRPVDGLVRFPALP